MTRDTMKLQSFDCEPQAVPPNTPAASRPSQRPRLLDAAASYQSPSLQCFDCEMVDLPAGTLAVPRPEGNERQLPIAEVVVEQKVVSILLSSSENRGKSTEEHFANYLSEGWKVKQLTSLATGGADGWIIVLLERSADKSPQLSRPA
jgi:hypothetical protein